MTNNIFLADSFAGLPSDGVVVEMRFGQSKLSAPGDGMSLEPTKQIGGEITKTPFGSQSILPGKKKQEPKMRIPEIPSALPPHKAENLINKAHQKDPYRWAGFFKDDPFREEMKAFINAERAELDAAQK